MNIELQCCALFIVFTITVMFLREKKLDLMNRRLFFRAICACFVCLFFDIFSIIMIDQTVSGSVPHSATEIVCKLYIMLLVLQGYFGYVYASTSLLPLEKTWAKNIRIVFHLIFAAGEVLILVLPIDFFADGRIVYSYGPSTLVAYLLSAVYIISTIVTTIVYRNQIPGRRFVAMLFWQGIWLLAAGIQFLVPSLLLVGFASAFGMVILYIQLENPSEYYDGSTGLFTTNALSAYIHDKYKFGRQFSMFTAKIHFLSNYVDYNMEHDAVIRTARALVALGPEPAFRIDDDTFCVVYDDKDRMFEKAADIKRQKDGVKDIPAKGTYLLIPDSHELSGPDEFFRFLHTYLESEQEIVICDKALINELRDQIRIKKMIDEALRNDRVEVFYQPFYNIKKSCFDVAEALVRIRLENGEIVAPPRFIPIAEESGQIRSLGIRVFEKVCEFIASGEAGKVGLEKIEINVSAAQFDRDDPERFVMENIQKYGISPEWINLEITETAATKNWDIMLDNMHRLIDKGVTFSLDDFGTGRSNIDYFVNMPVKTVKFDNTFTQGFFSNDRMKPVLTGMTDIVHKLDMSIVAEGIETEEQARAMKEMGVEYIQGYYYSRPLPKDELIKFLNLNNSMNE